MKYLISLSRILVGNLFIFSGLVKANDPLGFSYKLEEYFVEFGMDWAWLHDILVPMAAGLCIVEVILGVAVLVAYRMKWVSWSLLLMIVFFTILTGASAIFEIVRSCGCFGDAIPLTPWQSFYKDLILLGFILILFFNRNNIHPDEDKKSILFYTLISSLIMIPLSIQLDWWFPFIFTFGILGFGLALRYALNRNMAHITTWASLVASLVFSILAIEYLPFKDFRPYAIGKNLPEQMTLPPNAKAPVYENVLVYRNTKTGEEKEFVGQEFNDSKIWENKDWEWKSTDSKLIQEGDVAKITDLSILSHQDEDLTDQMLAKPNVLWIISYDLSLISEDHLSELANLAQQAKSKGIEVYALSSAGKSQVDDFKSKHKLAVEFMVVDGIVLKTMVRSNPGLMQLKAGTVVGKWHENKLPEIEELN